jgi:hypothetical protein
MTTNIEQEKKDATLRKELRQRMVGYIVGALGLVAGLAWNDAIKSSIEHFYKVDGAGILIKFLYALAITIFIVIVSYYVMKFTDSEKK